MRAPGHCAWRRAPRLGAAIGAWWASAQSARASGPDEPVNLGKQAPRVGAAATAADATLAAGRANCERDRLALQASSKLTESSTFKLLVKPVPRDAAAAAAQRLADLHGLRDNQQAKGAEYGWQVPRRSTNRWLMHRDGPSASMLGQAQWMWPCLCCMLHGCLPVVALILGGGKLEQRLNAADAAWKVAGWGKGQMRRAREMGGGGVWLALAKRSLA
jgi:hypothetical protein